MSPCPLKTLIYTRVVENAGVGDGVQSPASLEPQYKTDGWSFHKSGDRQGVLQPYRFLLRSSHRHRPILKKKKEKNLSEWMLKIYTYCQYLGIN